MNNMYSFKSKYFEILDKYNISSIEWCFFDKDINVTHLSIISIDGNDNFFSLSDNQKKAWDKTFKLLHEYSYNLVKEFGSNVIVNMSKDEIVINEYI